MDRPELQAMSLNDRNLSGIAELSHFLQRLADLVDFQGMKPATPNERSILGDTALHFAARWGDLRAGEILLDAGADPNVSGENGYTPLHNAILSNRVEFAKLLLAKGASKDLRGDDGLSAADFAKCTDNAALKSLFS